MLTALFEHRAFVANLVRREFQVRSARALWGNVWLVIEPAAQVLIYTLVFGRVLGARLPGQQDAMAYGVFICAGIITWGFFAELVQRSQSLFLEHAGLLKTMQFPRSTLPVAMAVTAGINFAIVAAIFLAVLAATGRFPGAALLAALPLLGVLAMLGLGLGVLTGTLNVFFRDVGRSVGIVLQFWFWLTPIVYPLSIVPEAVRPLYAWNPMVPIIGGFQRMAIEGAAPDWGALVGPALLAAGLLGAGWAVFRALSPDLVDEL